jgi:hypothetical protein
LKSDDEERSSVKVSQSRRSFCLFWVFCFLLLVTGLAGTMNTVLLRVCTFLGCCCLDEIEKKKALVALACSELSNVIELFFLFFSSSTFDP